MFENWWYAVLASIASVVVLFIMTRLMGKRQIAQLSFFDYVNGITIGSIAAELATMQNENFIRPLIAMIAFTGAAVLIALWSDKSLKARRFFEGRPLVALDNGKLYYENLKKARMDVNEFLTAARYEGYFDIADIQTAVIETNGQVSFLPKATARPLTPEDMNLNPSQDKMVANVIIDGEIMWPILKMTGNDEQWLRKQLDRNGAVLPNVLLGTVDGDNVFAAYEYNKDKDQDKSLFV